MTGSKKNDPNRGTPKVQPPPKSPPKTGGIPKVGPAQPPPKPTKQKGK
jgi:hypothetical protein